MAFPDEPRGADSPSPGGTPPSSDSGTPPSSDSGTPLSSDGAIPHPSGSSTPHSSDIGTLPSSDSGTPHSSDVPAPPQPHGEIPDFITQNQVTYDPTTDRHGEDIYAHEGDWSYGSSQPGAAVAITPELAPVIPAPPPAGGSGLPPKPPDDTKKDEDDDEEGGMLRMSFLEHLEELRKRLLLAIGGIGVAFMISLIFSNELWLLVSEPAVDALKKLKVTPATLMQISPGDVFQIVWMKLPILCAIFLSSPWILYQVWLFIAPGLYPKERKWAVPFVVSTAGLFISGGLFAYFVAFRYGLQFLLGLGLDLNVRPMISVVEYYDLFVDVMLGVGIVFEIPVLIFVLTFIRVVSPVFLVNHSRYAILAIVAIAAVITPTGDVFNLALFATPMILLFYVGIFAGYLLVLKREKRKFPWKIFSKWFFSILIVVLLLILIAAKYYGYHFINSWPLFSK